MRWRSCFATPETEVCIYWSEKKRREAKRCLETQLLINDVYLANTFDCAIINLHSHFPTKLSRTAPISQDLCVFVPRGWQKVAHTLDLWFLKSLMPITQESIYVYHVSIILLPFNLCYFQTATLHSFPCSTHFSACIFCCFFVARLTSFSHCS